jgi:hypothetical protein
MPIPILPHRPTPASPPEAPAPGIPLDPVPVRYRVDGWTAEKQRGFILVLAECGVARRAAAAVGMGAEQQGAGCGLRLPLSYRLDDVRGCARPSLVTARLFSIVDPPRQGPVSRLPLFLCPESKKSEKLPAPSRPSLWATSSTSSASGKHATEA